MFAEVDTELLGASSVDDVLNKLTRLGVQMVPGADEAAITWRSGSDLISVAPTGEVPKRADAIQLRLAEGPCIDAVFEYEVYRTGNIRSDRRWPRFGPEVADSLGISSILSSRLFLEDKPDAVAALNLYAYTVDAFDDAAESIATVLTTHAALALSDAWGVRRETHLRAALESSHTVGVAMGMLMGRHGISQDQAFAILTLASQHRQRKLADVARDVIEPAPLDGGKAAAARPSPQGIGHRRRS